MQSKAIYILTLSLAVLITACSPKDPIEQKVDQLLKQMTLDEKIGQMRQLEGGMMSDDLAGQIRAGQVGSLLNCANPQDVNYYQRIAVEDSRLGIPLLMGRDVIHGFKTIYPIPIGQAATWNPDLITLASRQTAMEATQVGIRWTFSPMVDVARDARWGRLAEGYGEDTYLTSVMGAATVRGYQGDSLNDPTAMAACVKHFAAYGASESGRDYNTTWIPEIMLRDVYLPPFKACLDAGAQTVMCSFNDINGLPSTANSHLNIDILRNEWGFDGLLVSDWGSSSDLVPHGLCADKKEACMRSFKAGLELEMEGHTWDYLKEWMAEGKITEKDIDDCVRDILRVKFRLGLFDHPYSADTTLFYQSEALQLAQRTVEESAILLKNDGVLPLDTSKCRTILITGPLADAPKEQLGTWIFDGEPEHSITPLAAFRNMSGADIVFEPCLNYSRDTSHAMFAKTIAAARKADVILYFAGEEAILSGEARCRADINLPGAQSLLMAELAKTGKPIVLVVMAGRPLTIGKELNLANAVLYSFHAGTMTGPGLYNVLTGIVNPSGKLPMTMPKMVGQVPIYYNRHNTGRPATTPMLIDNIPVGCPQFSIGQSSYHLEVGDQPLFPFGYGLSYTTFEYSAVELHRIDSENFVASCTVTNTGERDGQEIVQLYTHQKSGDLVRPIKELKGFTKVFIPKGESRVVEIPFTASQLGYWHQSFDQHDSHVWFATDDVDYELWLAPNSNVQTAPVSFRLHN